MVSADIRANINLRIALRVTSPDESADVIDTSDAAFIAKSTPGRCYIRSGASARSRCSGDQRAGRPGGTAAEQAQDRKPLGRQQLLAAQGFAGLAEHWAATSGADRLPWMLLLLDWWEGYVATFENLDYGRLIETPLQILREGSAVGLRAVFSTDRTTLIGQTGTIFGQRMIFRMTDRSDGADRPRPDLPPGPDGPDPARDRGEHSVKARHEA